MMAGEASDAPFAYVGFRTAAEAMAALKLDRVLCLGTVPRRLRLSWSRYNSTQLPDGSAHVEDQSQVPASHARAPYHMGSRNARSGLVDHAQSVVTNPNGASASAGGLTVSSIPMLNALESIVEGDGSHLDEQAVLETYSADGRVKKILIFEFPPKCKIFVEFEDKEGARKAYHALQGHKFLYGTFKQVMMKGSPLQSMRLYDFSVKGQLFKSESVASSSPPTRTGKPDMEVTCAWRAPLEAVYQDPSNIIVNQLSEVDKRDAILRKAREEVQPWIFLLTILDAAKERSEKESSRSASFLAPPYLVVAVKEAKELAAANVTKVRRA
ncbi:g2842 [Coccomyxa elongata]